MGSNMLRIDVVLQVVHYNMYVASCNMSRKHDTVLRGKPML